MAPSSHKQAPPIPKIVKILESAQRRTTYFLTPDSQPCAALPTGQSVPLHSADYWRWLSATLDEDGIIHPSPQQFAAAIKKLEQHAHSTLDVRPVHLRSVETKPHHYALDLHSAIEHCIEVNGKDWSIGDAFGLHFRRPTTNCALPYPRKTTAKLERYLELSFNLKESEALDLKNWLILAMLPNAVPPPFLIIRGKARDEATTIIRNLLDPAVNPILAIPNTPAQIADLTIRNRVLAFSLYGQFSKGKIAMLKTLRTGMQIPLREKNKHSAQIETRMQRPIIISSDEEMKFEADMLTLEINETADTYPDEFLGALLTAIVRSIRELTRQPARRFFTQPNSLPTPPPQFPESPAPYT